jgi:hypothetical protein
MTSFGTADIQNLQKNLISTIDSIDDAIGVNPSMNSKNTLLAQKQQRQIEQQAEIEDKTNLILTRSRMLQIAEERNMYKKKIIFSLLAVILLILIITLTTYVFFSKQVKK